MNNQNVKLNMNNQNVKLNMNNQNVILNINSPNNKTIDLAFTNNPEINQFKKID